MCALPFSGAISAMWACMQCLLLHYCEHTPLEDVCCQLLSSWVDHRNLVHFHFMRFLAISFSGRRKVYLQTSWAWTMRMCAATGQFYATVRACTCVCGWVKVSRVECVYVFISVCVCLCVYMCVCVCKWTCMWCAYNYTVKVSECALWYHSDVISASVLPLSSSITGSW